MTDAIRVFEPGFQVTNAAGVPQNGAILRFYAAGTSNTRTVYSNFELSSSLGVSVTCNSAGRPASAGNEVLIYTGTTPYKVTAETSAGASLWSFDNVVGALDTSSFLTGSVTAEYPVVTKTADYTVVDADQGEVINGNTTGGSFTFTLPSAADVGDGWAVTLRMTGTANSLAIATVSAQTINGQTTRTLSKRFEAIEIVSDAANWHVKSRVEGEAYDGSAFVKTNLPICLPQGRLTLTSATPVLIADVAAATSVYWTPYIGNVMPVYNGTDFTHRAVSELTLALHSSHSLNSHFDVFYFNDGPGTDRIGTGPAWTTITAGSGARGSGAGTTELTRSVGGILTNANSMTVRNGASTYTVAANRGTYLGSIYIDGTAGQITCHQSYGQSRKWGVWNAYNRRPIAIKAGDSNSSWNYNSGTIRASNGSSANSVSLFVGLPEEYPLIRFRQTAKPAGGAGGECANFIGYNSTTVGSGERGICGSANDSVSVARIIAEYLPAPAIGVNVITALESCPTQGGASNQTFFGTETHMCLEARWNG